MPKYLASTSESVVINYSSSAGKLTGNVWIPAGYRSCYDEGKECAEEALLFMDYYPPIRLAWIIRIFVAFMVRECFLMMMMVVWSPNFIIQALNNEELSRYMVMGGNRCSFQYIDDTIEEWCRMMNYGEMTLRVQINGKSRLGFSGLLNCLKKWSDDWLYFE